MSWEELALRVLVRFSGVILNNGSPKPVDTPDSAIELVFRQVRSNIHG